MFSALGFLTKSEEGWQQFNAAPVDLSALPETEQTEVIETTSTQLQASLNLSLYHRASFFNLGNRKPSRLLLLVIHHLAVDGAWRILLEDLQTAYQQIEGSCSIQLPAKTTSLQTLGFQTAQSTHVLPLL